MEYGILDIESDWVCEAFDPDENPLNVPIVQLSLFSSDDPDQHFRLGQALSALRCDNIQLIVSGMAVHNLRDYSSSPGSPEPKGYAVSFDEALKDAAAASAVERQEKLADLLKREDVRDAHPSLEHLLPIYVGAGAAGGDAGERIFTLMEGSLSWAQYRFGDVSANLIVFLPRLGCFKTLFR
jgi:4,5-DOPA dioxygenase extradiol